MQKHSVKILTIRKFFISAVVVLILAGGGCATAPNIRGFFERESERLNPPERRLLVETLRVLILLENYCAALEAREIEAVLACYSPRFSYYEKGVDWLRDWIRVKYLAPFDEVSVSMRDISIEFVQKDSGYWLRQEDFDWLYGLGEGPVSLPSFRIIIHTGSGPVEMFLGDDTGPSSSSPRRPGPVSGPPLNSSEPGPEPGTWTVSVTSSIDSGVERPLGEVTFQLLVKGRLAGCGGSEVFTCSMEEKVILLLEKEEGRWKIMSQW